MAENENSTRSKHNDRVMKSINKSLQKPIISGSVMPETDMVSTISTLSNASSISIVSNLSTISNSSLYTVRQERRMALYDYIRESSREYMTELLYHLGLTSVVAVLGGIIGTTVLYGWSLILSAFLIIIYGVMVSSNLSSILKVWRSDTSDGINRFWSVCMVLAYKNALILQEYIDVYDYVSRSDNLRRDSVKAGETFMVDDPNFQYIHPSEVKKIIERIHSYIRLAFELSHLTRSDNLAIQRGVVYCNVSEATLTNERNRKIENLLNVLEPQKRADIVDSWNSIDKKASSKYQSMTFIPFRWMIYEYRNLFRYLNGSPELRKVYNSIGMNFESYESCVTDISQALHQMRTDRSIFPSDLQVFTLRTGDLLGLSADSFFGLTFISTVLNSVGLLNIILSGLSTIVFGGLMHLITIITLREIRQMLEKDRAESLDNSKVDLVMKEMKVICGV